MLNKSLFEKTFALIVCLELLSLVSFFSESLMRFCFVFLILLVFIASLRELKFGLYAVFGELVIGSLGYLFWFDIGSQRFSLRIGIWLAVMGAWLIKYLLDFNFSQTKNWFSVFKNNFFIFWLFLLFFAQLFGLLTAFSHGNEIRNIFLDFNAWLFFLLFFPTFSVLKKQKSGLIKTELLSIAFAAALCLSVKTLIILYLFSHNFPFLPEIYRWIRDTRIGEITLMDSGFVRIFFQSHVFIIIAFFSTFLLFIRHNQGLKKIWDIENIFSFFLSSLFLAIIFLGYSRSNWLGLVFGFSILCLYLFITCLKNLNANKAFSDLFRTIFLFFSVSVFGFFFVFLTINFPWPQKSIDINAASLVSERTKNLSTEAGASSRWQLLPVLLDKIKADPIAGSGYGATLTYISNDPRVRENSPSGSYTTFAFEWGWLDIWIKIGLGGMLIYLIFIFMIFKRYTLQLFPGWLPKIYESEKKMVEFSFILGIIVIAGIHFFSPYLNHPLGIGYLIFLYLYFDNHFHPPQV